MVILEYAEVKKPTSKTNTKVWSIISRYDNRFTHVIMFLHENIYRKRMRKNDV